jgi:hypothetical protein
MIPNAQLSIIPIRVMFVFRKFSSNLDKYCPFFEKLNVDNDYEKSVLLLIISLFSMSVLAQNVKLSKENLEPSQVYLSLVKMQGKDVVKVEYDTTTQGADQPTFVKLKNLNLKMEVSR